jgi:hypothetical protein
MDKSSLKWRYKGSNRAPPPPRARREQYHYKSGELPRRPVQPKKSNLPHPHQAEFDLLEIPVTSLPDDIKKGYRLKALRYHPDKNRDQDTTKIFQAILSAYETLQSHYGAKPKKVCKSRTSKE